VAQEGTPAGNRYSSNIYNISLLIEFKVLCIYMYDCVCLGPALKRSLVKMQFNSINDLTDPSVRENVLKQVRERNQFNLYDYCEKHRSGKIGLKSFNFCCIL